MSSLADLLLELPDVRSLDLADNDITDASFEILARVSGCRPARLMPRPPPLYTSDFLLPLSLPL